MALKISIDELRALPQTRLNLSFNENLAGLEAVKPVLGELSLSYSVTGIRLTGRVKTLLKLHCDRCLRPYFQALTVDLEERFVPAGLMAEERDTEVRELLKDDFVEPLPDDGMLDISDVVYQAVTLATPTYCLCGTECPGPPVGGDDEESAAAVGTGSAGVGSSQMKKGSQPIDPRWKNLKTLFPNEDSQQNS
ncbi:MAG: YceD family protein [Terriglobales bacterium]